MVWRVVLWVLVTTAAVTAASAPDTAAQERPDAGPEPEVAGPPRARDAAAPQPDKPATAASATAATESGTPAPITPPATIAPAPTAVSSAPIAAARPAPVLPVDVTATMTAGWHAGERDYGELFGRLNVSRVTGPWRASVRVDTATFVSAPSPDVSDRYTLEKASITWTGRSVEVTAGDAYVSFGRGLGLSLRKLDELGVDTTLRGAKALVRHGDLDATVAAGYVNINNVDEATGTSVDDPYDLVGGVQVQTRLTERATVGAYAAAIAFHDSLGAVPTDAYTDRSAQFGAIFDAPRLGERAGLYVEAMGQALRTEPAAEDAMAFALYGSATGYFGPATLLLEGKAYGALTPLVPDLDAPAFSTVAYSSPPTVERVQQVLENAQRDIAGGRARVDWTFSPALVAFASYGVFRDWQGYADPATLQVVPGIVHDPYAGVEARWGGTRSWMIVAAGWRTVTIDGAFPGAGTRVRGDGHLDVNLTHAVDERWSLILHALHEERSKHESALLDEAFREGTVDAGFRLRPWLSVSAGYDYTTEPIQPRRDYVHGSVVWDITPASSVQLFVGSARGGLRCVSGVCRVVPPFEGIKLIATLRL